MPVHENEKGLDPPTVESDREPVLSVLHKTSATAIDKEGNTQELLPVGIMFNDAVAELSSDS